MGIKIIHNIDRVKGYLDVLIAEIHDPQKISPSDSRDELETLAKELTASLTHLEGILKSKNWESEQ